MPFDGPLADGEAKTGALEFGPAAEAAEGGKDLLDALGLDPDAVVLHPVDRFPIDVLQGDAQLRVSIPAELQGVPNQVLEEES